MGFGIQSPNDYAFLHDVIREKMPYYAYADIESRHPQATQRELRVRKLIFRVRNAFRGEKVIVINSDAAPIPIGSPFTAATVLASSPRTAATVPIGSPRTAATVPDGSPSGSPTKPTNTRAVILVGIQLNQSDLWQEILSLRHVITYDMQDIGIAIFDADRHAQHYEILPI